MNPTVPILASAGLVMAGGYAQEGAFPKYGVRALASFGLILVIVAFLAETRIRSVVNAFAWLFLLGVLYATVPAFGARRQNDRDRPLVPRRLPTSSANVAV